MTTSWGVTPHPQKTGTSPSRMIGASPNSGLLMSAMPSCFAASTPYLISSHMSEETNYEPMRSVLHEFLGMVSLYPEPVLHLQACKVA